MDGRGCPLPLACVRGAVGVPAPPPCRVPYQRWKGGWAWVQQVAGVPLLKRASWPGGGGGEVEAQPPQVGSAGCPVYLPPRRPWEGGHPRRGGWLAASRHPSPFRSGAAGFPQWAALPQLGKGWECPAPFGPASLLPRKVPCARVVADPHCCSSYGEQKAPLNRGGRGPDSREVGWRRASDTQRIFRPQPLSQFLKFLGMRNRHRGVGAGPDGNNADVGLRPCAPLLSSPLPWAQFCW